MGNAITRDVYQAIIEPFAWASDPSSLWAAESTYDEAGTVAGQPVAGQTSALVLRGTGPQTGQVQVRVAAGGHAGPGLGALSMLQRPGTSGSYYGWEGPASVSGLDALNWSASDPVQTSHVAGLPGGTLIAAGCGGSTPTDGGTLWVWHRSSTASTWTRVVVWDAATAGRDAFAPCVVAIDSTRAVLFAFVESPATGLGLARRVSISSWETSDGGATWTLRGEGLAAETDMRLGGSTTGSGTPGASVRRLRGAYRGGQILLVAHLRQLLVDGTRDRLDVLRQWASDDQGQSLVSVATYNGLVAVAQDGGYHDVAVLGGAFVVARIRAGVDGVYFARLGSAFAPITQADGYTTGGIIGASWDDNVETSTSAMHGSHSADYLTDGDLALTADDYGGGWVFVARVGVSGREIGTAWSGDYGQSWAGYGRAPGDPADTTSAATVARSVDAGNSFLSRISAAPSLGRVVMVAQPSVDTATSTEDSLLALYLGGWSTLTLPPVGDAGRTQDRGSWDQTALQIERPDDISGWTTTATGTSSAALTTSTVPALDLSTTGAGSTRYYVTTASFLDRTHLIGEWVVGQIVNGSSTVAQVAVEARVSNGSVTRTARVHLDSTAFRVIDANGGATLVNVTGLPDEVRQFRLGLDRVSGALRVWYRTYQGLSGGDRAWSGGSQVTVTDSGAAANNSYLAWGHLAAPPVATTTTSRWGPVQLARGRTDDPTGAFGLAGSYQLWHSAQAGTTDSLLGRPVGGPGYRCHVGRGLSVAAVDGPGRRGETWTCSTASTYPVQRIFPAVNRSPRRQWRSAASVTVRRLAIQVPGGVERELLTGFLGLVIRGANWRTGSLERRVGGVWSSIATLDLAAGRTSLAYQRYGRSIVPNGTSAGVYFNAQELDGWCVDFGSGVTRVMRLSENREGYWRNTGSEPRVQLLVDADPVGVPSTGNLSLWSPSGAWIIPSPGRVEGLRLVVDSQTTADGDVRIGQLLVGTAHVLPVAPSWGQSQRLDLGFDVARSRAGVASLDRAAPPAREVDIAWTDGVDLTGGWSGAAEDYLNPATSGTPMSPGTVRGAVRSLEGVLRRAQGLPMAYLPRVPPIGAGASFFSRREEVIVGAWSREAARDHILGDELSAELVRVPVLTLREEL